MRESVGMHYGQTTFWIMDTVVLPIVNGVSRVARVECEETRR